MGSALDFLSPFGALAAMALLMLLSRLVWGRHRHQVADYGLLVPIAEVVERHDAEAARDRLRAIGVRSTLGETRAVTYVTAQGAAVTRPAGHSILVFPQDVGAARDALAL